MNVLVSGATQAGKTTLLNALLAAGRPTDRVVTVEETFELRSPGRDSVAMQCRQPSLEGTRRGHAAPAHQGGAADAARPARRRRGARGGGARPADRAQLRLPGACSIHANSARDALSKLCTLPLLAGRNIDAAFVVPTVAACVELVVHCELQRSGRRRVTEILAPTGVVTRRRRDRGEPAVRARGRRAAADRRGCRRSSTKFVAAGLDPRRAARAGGVIPALGRARRPGLLLVLSPLLWPRRRRDPASARAGPTGSRTAWRGPASARSRRRCSCRSPR